MAEAGALVVCDRPGLDHPARIGAPCGRALAGFPVGLHATHVSGLPDHQPFGGNPAGAAFAAAAGPVATIALTLAGMVAFRRQGRPEWALALAALAPVRLAVGVLYGGLLLLGATGLVTIGSNDGGFDEAIAARALGLPAFVAVVPSLVLPLAIWWCWRVTHGQRRTGLSAIVAGGGAGLFVWVQVLGPTVLP